MPERRTIDERLSALERRLEERTPNGDRTGSGGFPGGESVERARPELAGRIESLEAEIAELEASLQALRGYLGTIDHVNETVERRANAAIAAVERLESAPKTPPPIATATPKEDERTTQVSEDPESQDAEQRETGLLERLRALR